MTEEPNYIEIDVVPDLTAWHRLAEEPSRGLFQKLPSSFRPYPAEQTGMKAISDTLQAIAWPRTHSKIQYLKRLARNQNWYKRWFSQSDHWVLEEKLHNHFEQREWQNLQKLTALWITQAEAPATTSKINHTWKG